MNRTKELILYRDMEEGSVFYGVASLIARCEEPLSNQQEIRDLYYESFHDLVELSDKYGFCGNLWQSYLTWLLVSHENAYSRACEIREAAQGALRQIALHDMAVFLELFRFDFNRLNDVPGIAGASIWMECPKADDAACVLSRRIRDRIHALCVQLSKALCAEAFLELLAGFYREFGVGKLGLHRAFRIERTVEHAEIAPIFHIAQVALSDLVGYEAAKEKLLANTEAFVCGRPANNCLLYGDAGTGKSSSIKAIVNQYYDRGLRIIELYRHQFRDLHDIIAQIKHRNYRFILYMDDLSFEESETEYKYLKAVIEGGLEKKPENVLIYATSNRRHLVREKFSDKAQLSDELHNNDTVQEKLSLAARFGVQIYFGAPDKRAYHEIVRSLARQQGVAMEEEALLLLADQWELHHGGRSGRTAQQFINDRLGREEGL